MKHIRLPLCVLAVGLAASSLLPTRSLSAPQTNLGHPEGELIALETLKNAYLFGTPQQKQLAVQMYDPDFQGIGFGPSGLGRLTYASVQASVAFFPLLPPGIFTYSDWHVLQVGTNTYVVSYITIGPGPTGQIEASYQASTWTRRAENWKTIFFQQTPIPVP